jgi:hypothetical protein
MARSASTWGGRLLLLTNLAAANAAAAVAVVAFVRPAVLAAEPSANGGDLGATTGPRQLLLQLDSTWAWGAFAGAIFLLLANFTWLVRPKRPLAQEAFVLSETPAGVVRIAREALENALQRAAEGLPVLTRVRVRVALPSRTRVVVHCQYCCAEGVGSLAASQRLRATLASRCDELVRLGEGGKIEFELEFLGFQGKLGKGVVEASAEEEAPFTGPKYPIDDESSGGLR